MFKYKTDFVRSDEPVIDKKIAVAAFISKLVKYVCSFTDLCFHSYKCHCVKHEDTGILPLELVVGIHRGRPVCL